MTPASPDDPYATALRLAALVHAGQTWKGTPLPYLTHVVHVAHLLNEDGQPRTLVLAGLLHDTLEDVDGTHETRARLRTLFPDLAPDGDVRAALADLIARRFGRDVRRLVEEVTALPADPPETAAQRRARRERQLAHLRDARADVATLKAADTCANVSALVAVLDAPRGGSFSLDELRWYYGGVADIVASTLSEHHPLVAALRGALAALDTLQRS